MQKTGGTRRITRVFGVGVLAGCLILAFGAAASNAEEGSEASPASATPSTPSPPTPSTGESDDSTSPPGISSTEPQFTTQSDPAKPPPYGTAYPVTLETNFSRPYKSISSSANSDFSQLNDLERIIRGSYRDPRTGNLRPASVRKSNYVNLSVSRMENSHRVGRELIKAAKAGVEVYVIHGKASQSKESRALQKSLRKLKHGHFKICVKGKSLACLSQLNGAIMHSKILLVNSTYTRDNKPAKGVIWTGSANLGGPSGERTYNNGLTIYNDMKLWYQMRGLWKDMYAERNVGNDYPAYVKKHRTNSRYRITSTQATNAGYSASYPIYGMFYSNLANVTIYPTPIRATPMNGRDPVIRLLDRIVPDDQCRIRLQQNRFKYRRIAVAQKITELVNQGCKASIVGFEDNLKVNRVMHCQQYIRVCRPILDVFKTADRRIEAAWAKPHDKTILVEAILKPNKFNPEERTPSGDKWPTAGLRTKLVQAGSAALTGSNLNVSDEITIETIDPAVYADYLDHWKAIWKSKEIHNYPY